MPRTSKYGTAPRGARTFEGVVFDSKREMEVYKQYRMILGRGELTGLDRQVPYPMVVNGVKVCTYFADMVLRWRSGLVEAVDVKGVETDVFKLKRKLLAALYPDVHLRIVK